MASTYDSSAWKSQMAHLSGTRSWHDEVTIHYVLCEPRAGSTIKGTVLLIHGYPETWYQFRHVINPLAEAGFRVVVPDYRGAGDSSKPRSGYDKATMAADLHSLVVDHLQVQEKVHIVGHDIGGMVAHAYAVQYPTSTASLTWGECPLPGSSAYETAIREGTRGSVWHFVFHWQLDVPEMLVAGKERQYLKSFYNRLCVNAGFLAEADIDEYARKYSMSGGMRAGFDVYRAFHKDAEDNMRWLKEKGKCSVPSMTLNGAESFLAEVAQEQNEQLYLTTESATVAGASHYIAEENPQDFVKKVLDWVEKHPTKRQQ